MGTYDTIGGTPRDDVKYNVEQPIPRCPLIMLVNMVGLGKYYSTEDIDNDCIGDQCGFWSNRHEMCSIAVLGNAVAIEDIPF